MKKIKNMLISIGAFSTIVAPVVTVVSCGNGDDQGTTVHLDDVQIDVSNKSVEETIDSMVKALHVNMDAIGANEDAWSISDDMSKILRYMDQVDTNKTITLVNGTDKYTMDFSPINHWVNNIKAAAEMEDNPNVGKGTEIGVAIIGYGMPEIGLYTGAAMGTDKAASMAEFMTLSTDDFSSMDPNTFFDNHGYIQMLNEYHTIFWNFVNSDFYKIWIVGRKFVLVDNATQIKEFNPGEMYDNPDEEHGALPPKKHDGEIQCSNFETEFGLRLLNAYGDVLKTNPLAYWDFENFTYATSGAGHFEGDIDLGSVKQAFPDFNNATINDGFTEHVTPYISPLPTGWSKAPYYLVNSDFSTSLNPDISTVTSTINKSTTNIFQAGLNLYWKN